MLGLSVQFTRRRGGVRRSSTQRQWRRQLYSAQDARPPAGRQMIEPCCSATPCASEPSLRRRCCRSLARAAAAARLSSRRHVPCSSSSSSSTEVPPPPDIRHARCDRTSSLYSTARLLLLVWRIAIIRRCKNVKERIKKNVEKRDQKRSPSVSVCCKISLLSAGVLLLMLPVITFYHVALPISFQ